MKSIFFIFISVAALAMIYVQHRQLGQLQMENAQLQPKAAAANAFKAELARSTGDEAQDTAEIERLREKNHDLLKLRNEVNQLRETRVQFEKVSAENQRLQAAVKIAVKAEPKTTTQPVVLRMDAIFNRGLNTPEDAVQTFYWAQRERNSDILSSSVTTRSWNTFGQYLDDWRQQYLKNIGMIQIIARRDVDATTVEFGLQLQQAENPQYGDKIIIRLVLQGNDWRVDSTSR